MIFFKKTKTDEKKPPASKKSLERMLTAEGWRRQILKKGLKAK